jgi:hypothetical protein
MKVFACIWSGLFLYITVSALIYPRRTVLQDPDPMKQAQLHADGKSKSAFSD